MIIGKLVFEWIFGVRIFIQKYSFKITRFVVFWLNNFYLKFYFEFLESILSWDFPIKIQWKRKHLNFPVFFLINFIKEK